MISVDLSFDSGTYYVFVIKFSGVQILHIGIEMLDLWLQISDVT